MVLFPNLLGEACLARVTYKSHHNLKSVCRSWRSFINSPGFYQQRKAAGTAEQHIFMLQSFLLRPGKSSNQQRTTPVYVYGIAVYDPVQGEWMRIPSLPEFGGSVPIFGRCVSVRGKFILIGGWHPPKWRPSVFIYDVLSGGWTRGADMPTLRSSFGCCVSPDGIIYVAGGHDGDKKALRSVEAYSVEKDEWENLPTMRKGRDECEAVFTDGQLVVLKGFEIQSQWHSETSAEVFKPETRSWKVMENMWIRHGDPRFSVVESLGYLYFFSHQGVMRHNATENRWTQVVDNPEDLLRVSPRATACRDKIFVSGSDNGPCYMFEPQHGKWVAIRSPRRFRGFVRGAATLEF